MGNAAPLTAFAGLPLTPTQASSGTIATQPVAPFNLGGGFPGKIWSLLSTGEALYSRLIWGFLFDWYRSEYDSFPLLEVSVIDACQRS